MRDDLFNNIIPEAKEPIDPRAMARRDLQKHLPKRFWSSVTVDEREGGYAVLLDGRPTRTPAKNALSFPTRAAAEAVADEWRAVGELVDPAQMPMTRLANSAIDGVSREINAVVDDLVKYAGSDLLCYRAADPERLAIRQTEQWDPILDWAHEEFGARFVLAEGIVFVGQPAPSITALREAVLSHAEPLPLAALHSMCTLMGSVILALAVARKRLATAEAWALAHLDEDFQMEVWGMDEEAMARRAVRWADMQASSKLFHLTSAR